MGLSPVPVAKKVVRKSHAAAAMSKEKYRDTIMHGQRAGAGADVRRK